MRHPVQSCQLLFLSSIQIEERNKKVEERTKQQKEKVKTRVDKTCKVKETKVKVGDTVLVRQSKKNRFSTSYEPQPYKVVSIKGSSVTARRGDEILQGTRPSIRNFRERQKERMMKGQQQTTNQRKITIRRTMMCKNLNC